MTRAERRLRSMGKPEAVQSDGPDATLEQGRWFFCGAAPGNKKGGGPEDPPPQFVSGIRP
jgi:hypothetical protein